MILHSLTYIHKSMSLVLFLFFFSTLLTAQEKEDFKNKKVCFFVKSHYYQSQKVADSLSNDQKKLMEEFKSGKSLWPPPPPFRLAEAYESNYIDYLFVSPKKIVFQYTPRFLTGPDENQNYVNLRLLFSKTILRDSLTERKITFISNPFVREETTPIKYMEQERFPMVSENKDVVKTINGFKCHQVILKGHAFGTGNLIEMFVTEQIRLEYHPFLNVKEYLDKFYPLYIKSYDPNFPLESYEEYEYEMYGTAF